MAKRRGRRHSNFEAATFQTIQNTLDEPTAAIQMEIEDN
jgi:hypothetical protein